MFEFLASYNREKFEVECKAKTVDAGRKVARAAVYQFADRLAFSEPYQNAKRQPRHLKITTTSRFPTDLREQATLTKAIEALLQDEGTNELAFATVSIENISADELKVRATAEREEFEHRLVSKELVISVQSRKPDEFIRNIERDLRDALSQFSGTRPSLVVCYVPEMDTFEGAEKPGTATHTLAQRFLSHRDARNVVSLTFVSDPQIDARSGEIETGLPMLRFVSNSFAGSPIALV